jgi:hypothetical protein
VPHTYSCWSWSLVDHYSLPSLHLSHTSNFFVPFLWSSWQLWCRSSSGRTSSCPSSSSSCGPPHGLNWVLRQVSVCCIDTNGVILIMSLSQRAWSRGIACPCPVDCAYIWAHTQMNGDDHAHKKHNLVSAYILLPSLVMGKAHLKALGQPS